MSDEELEQILSSEDALAPSSGFARGVMAAVRTEVAAPPPLPFPWLRFFVGIGACLVMAAAGAALSVQADGMVRDVAVTLRAAWPELGYAAMAVFGSLALARFPRVFARD